MNNTQLTGADLLNLYPKCRRSIEMAYKEFAGESFKIGAPVAPEIIAQLDAKWPRNGKEKTARNPRKIYAKSIGGEIAQTVTFARNVAPVIAQDCAKEVAQIAQPIARNIAPSEIAQPAQAETSEGEISQEKMAVEIVVFCALCIVIVEVHALLIWYDAFKIWKAWGLFGGAIAFAFQNAAILLASNKNYTDLSEWALMIVGVIDLASLSLHIPCFTAGSGRSTVDVSDILTIGFCIFIVGFSYASFALFRAVKNR